MYSIYSKNKAVTPLALLQAGCVLLKNCCCVEPAAHSLTLDVTFTCGHASHLGAAPPFARLSSPTWCRAPTGARKVLGWPERCKLAHACLREYGDKRLKSAHLLGQPGVPLTWVRWRL